LKNPGFIKKPAGRLIEGFSAQTGFLKQAF
jgi:hypothetical protein